MHSVDTISSPASLNWYLRLRWIALAAQVVALAATSAYGFELDLGALGALLGFEAVVGAALASAGADRLRPVARWLAGLLTLDAVVLVTLLYLTGGPHNPMSVVLMVNVALAAFMLKPAHAWSVTLFTIGLSSLLFVSSRPLLPRGESTPPTGAQACPMCGPADGAALNMQLHLQGMWAGYLVAGAAIVWFIARLRTHIEAREQELRRSEAARQTAERRARMAALAAGAAHELATPLASVMLASEGLQHHLEVAGDREAADEARVIREQIRRCRGILEQMAYQLGQPAGGASRVVSVGELVDTALKTVEASRVVTPAGWSWRSEQVHAIGSALEQALRNLVDNALRASSGPVSLDVEPGPNDISLVVRDRGIGMTGEELDRAGDPFFSTRPHGEGMGLGLFVARTVAEQLGGELNIASERGRGTTVTMRLPRATGGVA
jgi:two-component system sensor histidine kinase RegB